MYINKFITNKLRSFLNMKALSYSGISDICWWRTFLCVSIARKMFNITSVNVPTFYRLRNAVSTLDW
jgi:hypothetical protein